MYICVECLFSILEIRLAMRFTVWRLSSWLLSRTLYTNASRTPHMNHMTEPILNSQKIGSLLNLMYKMSMELTFVTNSTYKCVTNSMYKYVTNSTYKCVKCQSSWVLRIFIRHAQRASCIEILWSKLSSELLTLTVWRLSSWLLSRTLCTNASRTPHMKHMTEPIFNSHRRFMW